MRGIEVCIEYQGISDATIRKFGSSFKLSDIHFIRLSQTKSESLFQLAVLITMPFVDKIANGIAASVGEDIWSLIKNLFGSKKGKQRKKSIKLAFQEKGLTQKIRVRFEAVDTQIASSYIEALDSLLPLAARRMKENKLVSVMISNETKKKHHFIVVDAKRQNGTKFRLLSLQVE